VHAVVCARPSIYSPHVLGVGGNACSASVYEEEWNEPRFVCHRVCTTPRLLKKLGGAAKVGLWSNPPPSDASAASKEESSSLLSKPTPGMPTL